MNHRISFLAHAFFCRECEPSLFVSMTGRKSYVKHPYEWKKCEIGTLLYEKTFEEDPDYDNCCLYSSVDRTTRRLPRTKDTT